MQTAILTSSLTVVGGLIIFFISQLILKYIIEPLSDYRKLRSQISIQLIYYANIYSNLYEYNEENSNNEKLVKRLEEVSDTFRRLASELIGVSNIIPAHLFFSVLGILPNRKKIMKASSSLIGLSNSLWKYGNNTEDRPIEYNMQRRNEIIQLLNIKSI